MEDARCWGLGARTVRRARTIAVAIVVLALAVPIGGVASASPDVSDDPDVQEAREKVEAVQSELQRLSGQLDAAAAAYEQAQAHHLRLVEELESSDTLVNKAQAQTQAVRDKHGERIIGAYKRPDARMSLATAVLMAPDPATGMHRAMLVERMALRGAEMVDRAARAEELTADAVRQHQMTAGGAAGAVQDRNRLAAELNIAVNNARHQVDQAQADFKEAEREAIRRAEERERAARAASMLNTLGGQAPLPRLDGKYCPIGSPNGFIDSWGFPRSGGRRHQGVDMFAAYGMPIYAVNDGSVRVTTSTLGGLSIHLIDTDGHRYYYAHLSAVAVTSGQRVAAGQVIGSNGDSGNARGTPPHLHWQYHPNNGPAVNPYPLAVALCR